MNLLELTTNEKNSFPKVALAEAIRKKEFWILNALTFSRLAAGVLTFLLASNLSESSNFATSCLLNMYSWTADAYDGAYARFHEVSTEFGDLHDHGLADGAAFAGTVYLVWQLLT